MLIRRFACRLRRSERSADRRAPRGQSFVDLALVLPIFLLTMLGAASLGMALYQQSGLSQTTQQAAQYLYAHPITTDPACTAAAIGTGSGYTACAQTIVANYLTSHGAAGAQVAVSFTTTASGVLMDTIVVSKKVALPVPLPSQINAGSLHDNSIWISAKSSTIAALPVTTKTTTVGTCPATRLTAYNPATSPITATVSISGTQTSVSAPVIGAQQFTITNTGTCTNPNNTVFIAEPNGLSSLVAIGGTANPTLAAN